jgi:hypothetical protein
MDESERENAADHLHKAIAFREMCLVDEAVREYELALADPDLRLQALRGLAGCHVDRGERARAADALRRALELCAPWSSDEVAIRFWISRLAGDEDDDPLASTAVRIRG